MSDTKPERPADWDEFVAWFKTSRPFIPRSWNYDKAPRWLWEREYAKWHSGKAKP